MTYNTKILNYSGKELIIGSMEKKEAAAYTVSVQLLYADAFEEGLELTYNYVTWYLYEESLESALKDCGYRLVEKEA